MVILVMNIVLRINLDFCLNIWRGYLFILVSAIPSASFSSSLTWQMGLSCYGSAFAIFLMALFISAQVRLPFFCSCPHCSRNTMKLFLLLLYLEKSQYCERALCNICFGALSLGGFPLRYCLYSRG